MSRRQIALTLGPITFEHTEVPDQIKVGAEQVIAPHRLIGGRTVFDTMGGSDAPMTWDADFTGADALARAQALNRMCKGGLPYELRWSELAFTVLISHFEFVFQANNRLPYTITLEVVEDLATPAPITARAEVGQLLEQDQLQVQALSGLLQDPALDARVAGVSDAMRTAQTFSGSAGSFIGMAQETLNGIIAPVQDVMRQVDVMLLNIGETVTTVSSLGGVSAGRPAADMVTSLLAEKDRMTRLPILYDVRSLAGRMSTNLQAVGQSGRTLVTGGGDLYRLAAEEYGDLTEWTGIAKANGRTDPVLDGLQELRLPSGPEHSGGVLRT